MYINYIAIVVIYIAVTLGNTPIPREPPRENPFSLISNTPQATEAPVLEMHGIYLFGLLLGGCSYNSRHSIVLTSCRSPAVASKDRGFPMKIPANDRLSVDHQVTGFKAVFGPVIT
jgi:hypothetical protein